VFAQSMIVLFLDLASQDLPIKHYFPHLLRNSKVES
jgi:hypothetical protein